MITPVRFAQPLEFRPAPTARMSATPLHWESSPALPGRTRTSVNLGHHELEQRLRESQPQGRQQGPAMTGKGSWGAAAQMLGGHGAGAYQTDTQNYQDQGVDYQKTTTTGPKGYSSTTVTYEKDGVSYVETTTISNGTTTVRVEATSGDRTEVSTSQTVPVPGDLASYVDADSLGQIQADASNGVGVTTRTTTKTEVVDNSQTPPLVTVTQQSTGYSQQLSQIDGLEGGQEVSIPNGAQIDDPRIVLPAGQYDSANSGLYVSYTVQTVPVAGSVLQSETRIKGTGPDGHPISVVNSRTETNTAGQPPQIVTRHAESGTIAREDAEQAFQERMGTIDDSLTSQLGEASSPWLDFEVTTTDSGQGGISTTSQFGELHRQGQDSISVIQTQQGDQKSVTYQQVSQGGMAVHSETHIQGSNYRSISDTSYGENGSFRNTTSSYAGDLQISSSSSSREELYAGGAALPAQAPEGFTQEFWDIFRQAHPHGPVYRSQMEGWELGLDGQRNVSSREQIAVQGSVIGYAQSGDSRQTYYQLAGEESKGAVQIDSSILAVDTQGQFTLNGETLDLPLQVSSVLVGGQGALKDLSTILSQSSELLKKFPSLKEGGGLLNMLSGGWGALSASNWQDRLGGLSDLTQGFSDLTSIFGTSGRLGMLAEKAGYAGAGLQVLQGISELIGSNYAEGAADAVSGVAGLAALALAANPGAAAVLGLVAVGAGLVRFFLDWGDDQGPPPAYSLEGNPPDWTFAA